MVLGIQERDTKAGRLQRYNMKKVYLKGPLLTQSGYGHHARTILRALKSRPDLYDIYVQPIKWGETSWIWQDTKERQSIDRLLTKTIEYIQSGGKFDVSLQVTIPNEWEKLAPINIGITAGIETTLIDPSWIEKSNSMDKIITISKHSQDGFLNTVYNATNNNTGENFDFKCNTKVEYVGYPVEKYQSEDLELKLTTNFNFLTVSQLSARKNVEQLIRCFVEKFKDNEDVGLIIKGNMAKNSLIDRNSTLNGFRNIISKYKDRKCKIYLLHGFLTNEEMSGLYSHPKVKAVVSTTHGEGYGLPLFEAAYYGLPVLATNWSGHLDFLYMPKKQKNGKIKNKHMFGKINYNLKKVQEQAVWKGVVTKDSMWAFPEDGSIKMNLQELYNDHGRFLKRAKDLQEWVCEEFDQKKIYNKICELIEDDQVAQPVSDNRVVQL